MYTKFKGWILPLSFYSKLSSDINKCILFYCFNTIFNLPFCKQQVIDKMNILAFFKFISFIP